MDRRLDPRLASPTLHLTIFALVAIFATALVLSIVLEVEIVARGQGRVVPLSRVQVIEPEFDGRIAAIRVENGQRVGAGDVLVALDPTDARAELARREAEDLRLRIERARIDTSLDAMGGDPAQEGFVAGALGAFAPPDGDPRYAQEQRLLLAAELEELMSAAGHVRIARSQQRPAPESVPRGERRAPSMRRSTRRDARSRPSRRCSSVERWEPPRPFDVLDESTRFARSGGVLER